MAITAAALQAVLGVASVNQPRVMKELPPFLGTQQHWLVSGGTAYPGRVKKISTTAADNAATQGAAVLARLLDGPNA
jgi:hypothetical protein